jgi:hypothetical protein
LAGVNLATGSDSGAAGSYSVFLGTKTFFIASITAAFLPPPPPAAAAEVKRPSRARRAGII